jgi:hypothetical protein
MKKIIGLLTTLALVSACTITDSEDHLVTHTYNINVHPSEWQAVNNGADFYIYAEKTFPEITPGVIEEGVVLVYYVDGYYNLLPYIRSYDVYFFEVIRFDITEGKIAFIIESNQAYLPLVPDTSWLFKVVVMSKTYRS